MTFEEDCIEVHNRMRELHQAGPLKKKSDLTSHAQMWADKLAKSGKLQHSKDTNFGENIAMTTQPNPTAEEMTKMWYDEIQLYKFNRPGFSGGTGHFTQLVWKDTTHIGVGVASGKYGTFVVANYEPAGNFTNPGYFEKNVVPPTAPYTSTACRRRHRTSSSSSSSSSSDDEKKMKKRSTSKSKTKGGSSGSKNVETKVDTKTREFTDSQGRRVRETTITTTTITTEGRSTSTSTNTKVETEYLSSASGGSPAAANQRSVHDDFGQMQVKDDCKAVKLSDKDKKKFREECLKRHNDLRARHGSPSLKVDKDLQKKAQEWADRLLKNKRLEHREDRSVGENVAYKFASNQSYFPGDQITDMWYDEIQKYNFSKPGFLSGTGHFTQVVWKNSTKIGVGVATDGKGTIYAVANYSPPGNFMNQFKENVLPPKK